MKEIADSLTTEIAAVINAFEIAGLYADYHRICGKTRLADAYERRYTRLVKKCCSLQELRNQMLRMAH